MMPEVWCNWQFRFVPRKWRICYGYQWASSPLSLNSSIQAELFCSILKECWTTKVRKTTCFAVWSICKQSDRSLKKLWQKASAPSACWNQNKHKLYTYLMSVQNVQTRGHVEHLVCWSLCRLSLISWVLSFETTPLQYEKRYGYTLSQSQASRNAVVWPFKQFFSSFH